MQLTTIRPFHGFQRESLVRLILLKNALMMIFNCWLFWLTARHSPIIVYPNSSVCSQTRILNKRAWCHSITLVHTHAPGESQVRCSRRWSNSHRTPWATSKIFVAPNEVCLWDDIFAGIFRFSNVKIYK